MMSKVFSGVPRTLLTVLLVACQEDSTSGAASSAQSGADSAALDEPGRDAGSTVPETGPSGQDVSAKPSDVSAPVLTLGNTGVYPILYAPRAAISEPLAPGAILELVGDTQMSFAPEIEDGAVTAFAPVDFRILPFAGLWKVKATGTDLSGLPLLPVDDYRTVDDPGIFAEDGFETATGEVVDSSVGIPVEGKAILGQPILHLSRKGRSTLHYVLVVLGEQQDPTDARASLTFGTIGGHVHTAQVRVASVERPIHHERWNVASERVTGSVTLSESGDDVIIQFNAPSEHSPGPGACLSSESLHCFNAATLLIEDVRLE